MVVLIDGGFVPDNGLGENIDGMFEGWIASKPHNTVNVNSGSNAGGCNCISPQIQLDKLALSSFSCQENIVATFLICFCNHILCTHDLHVSNINDITTP